MPNWVQNKLIISNSPSLIKKIQEHSKQNKKTRPGFMASFFKNYNQNDVNWYDINIQNFGTKWDFFEYNLTENEKQIIIEFQTAWSPPREFIIHLQKLYKKATIILEFLGEGSEFAGIMNPNDELSNVEFDPYSMNANEIINDELMPEWIKLESFTCSLYGSKTKNEFKKNFFLIPPNIRHTSEFLNDLLCNVEDTFHQDCLKDIYKNLSKINDNNILYLLVKRPFLSKSQLSKLYETKDLHIIVSLCANNSVDEDFLKKTVPIINKTKNESLISEMMDNLSNNSNCPLHFFDFFKIPSLSYSLSLNTKTPIHILHKILQYEELNDNRSYIIDNIKKHKNYKNVASQILQKMDNT